MFGETSVATNALRSTNPDPRFLTPQEKIMHSDPTSAVGSHQEILNRIRAFSVRLLSILAVLGLALGAAASAQTTTCTTGSLPEGTGGDLIVSTGTCTVGAGTFQYRNVKIISGGTLSFTDNNIDFW